MAEINEDLMKTIGCALSNENCRHVCQEPMLLGCKHYVCKGCILPELSIKVIQCNICQIRSPIIEANNKILDGFNSILNENLNEIFTLMCEQYKKNFERCKNMVNENEECIDNRIESVKFDVAVQVESIKIGLDKRNELIDTQLDDIRKKWKNDLLESNNKLLNEKNVQRKLKELEKCIAKQQGLTVENLYMFQSNLKSIEEGLKAMNFIGSVKFTLGNIDLQSLNYMIGEITCIGEEDISIMRRIKSKIIAIGVENESIPLELRALNDTQKLSAFYKGGVRTDRGRSSAEVNLVTDFNRHYRPFSFATVDHRNLVYISDPNDNRIFVLQLDELDSQFKVMKRFERQGNYGHDKKLGWSGLCSYNGSLFVCDYDGKAIVKINIQQKSIEETFNYMVDYHPYDIKRINNVGCVRCDYDRAIRFYNLDDFALIREYLGHNGCIGVSKLCFYEYSESHTIFYCYNSKGEMIEEIEFRDLDQYRERNVHCMDSLHIFNSKLLLCLSSYTKIICI